MATTKTAAQVPTYIYPWLRDRLISGESGRIEHQILEARVMHHAANLIVAAGYKVEVRQGGEPSDLDAKSTAKEIMLDSMQCDEDVWVVLDADGEALGWLRFVQGNHPSEVLCDYTMSLSTIGDATLDYADTFVDR